MELTIEKLIYGGDGLARLPADSEGRRKAAFVPLVLPGETVEARVVEEKPGFVRAQLEKVITPSPDRIAALVRTSANAADATISTQVTNSSSI